MIRSILRYINPQSATYASSLAPRAECGDETNAYIMLWTRLYDIIMSAVNLPCDDIALENSRIVYSVVIFSCVIMLHLPTCV
jgi:hypothetical protein